MSRNSFIAGPGEMDYDIDHDEDDDYNDARCEDCGAGPDERCTEDCHCDDCRTTCSWEDGREDITD